MAESLVVLSRLFESRAGLSSGCNFLDITSPIKRIFKIKIFDLEEINSMTIDLLLFFLLPLFGLVASIVVIARTRNSEHGRHFHHGAGG
jgi:hypothetical protein